MKINKMVLTFGIIMVALVLYLTLLDDSLFIREYNVKHDMDEFYNISFYTYNKFDNSSNNFTTEGLGSSNEGLGQNEQTNQNWDAYYQYQLKAHEQSWKAIFPLNGAKTLLTDLGDILHINPLFIGGIIGFISLSIAFALIYAWLGRKP